MYVAFEGPEGGGKDTQVDLLMQVLIDKGCRVLKIIEPGGTRVGQAIRDVLLNKLELTEMLGTTEAFLFSASRTQQVEEVVRPALQEGTIILSVRSFYSTEVYQGYASGVSLKLIKSLTSLAVEGTRPDYGVLLDLPSEVGLRRKNDQNEMNRLDLKELSYHTRVREGYLQLAKEDQKVWVVIDATASIEEVHEQVLVFVLDKIS